MAWTGTFIVDPDCVFPGERVQMDQEPAVCKAALKGAL